MIEQLISRVFQARDIAHRAHWKTKSYAQHVALGEFYDGVIGDIDALVECYQGQFGLVGTFGVSVPSIGNTDFTQYLQGEADWIEQNCDAIAKESVPVENLIASLLETYNVTLYKLNNLS